MGAVIAFITAFLPQAITIGAEIAPLISSIRAAYSSLGSAQGATQADFDALDALLKPYEDDLQAQAASVTSAPDPQP